ncbi:hypothetical protein AX14_007217 [Amanita brunnescens Koide BX004]|nr:hypothetical protein AX14_007217 [Amanita brunnescens Koide BX004]
MVLNLFHSCLHYLMKPLVDVGMNGTAMADGMGVVRRVHPLLAVYVGDYPEQVLATCIKSGECPKCNALRDELDDSESLEPRDIGAVYDALAKVSGDYQIFKGACKQAHIKPIAQPFWDQLPFLDIFQAITPDILHQLHQGVFKHVIKWLVKAFGGISGLSRVTGKEHALIGCVILGVIADIHLPGGFDSSRLLRAAHALLDFMYLAQLPVISTQHLTLLDRALSTFHQNKSIFVDLGIRDSFNIPKLHACFHYAHSIRLFGSTDNYNTQHTERLHIDLAKTAYHTTNTRDELPQMTTWLERREQVYQFAAYIAWRHQHRNNQPASLSQPLPRPTRYIKMTRYPSASVSINNLKTEYEQEILDVHLPFNSVSVYHYIRYQDDNGSESTVDSIRIWLHRKDNKGRTVEGQFDTGLICTGAEDRIGIHAYCIAQIRVIFSIKPAARKLLFGNHNNPPHHLAYVEWFTPFQTTPEPKTGLLQSVTFIPAECSHREHCSHEGYSTKHPSLTAPRKIYASGVE